jgi:curved DNA-binding protein CbpA
MMRYFKYCKTLDEAKKAYYKLCLELHPDRGGDHFEFIEMRKQFEGFRPETEKFEGEQGQWIPEDYQKIIDELLKHPFDVTIAGSWIWVGTPSKEYAETIKGISADSFRRGWSRGKSMWYFSPKDYRKRSKKELSWNRITELYGANKVHRSETKKLNA